MLIFKGLCLAPGCGRRLRHELSQPCWTWRLSKDGALVGDGSARLPAARNKGGARSGDTENALKARLTACHVPCLAGERG